MFVTSDLKLIFSFGSLSVNPKNEVLGTFYQKEHYLPSLIDSLVDTKSVLLISIGHHFLLTPWQRFVNFFHEVVRALERKRAAGTIGPVVWRLCNFRIDLSGSGANFKGMSLASNNVRLHRLNRFVRRSLPDWVDVVDWGTASAVGLLSGHLHMYGYNHPVEHSWMFLQLAFMLRSVPEHGEERVTRDA